MAKTDPILIGNRTTLIRDPVSTISVAPDGSAEGKVIWRTDWALLFNVLPAPLSPHPDFPQLRLYESTVARELGNIGRIEATYRGIAFGGDNTGLQQYETNYSTSEAPVETHPLFAGPNPSSPIVTNTELQEINKALEQNRAPVGLSAPALLLYTKKLRGIESYYRVQVTYRINYSDVSPPSDYAQVGKIKTPPGSNVPGLASGQNWLFIGFSWRLAGGVTYITEEFLASGLGGWDADLYAQ